MISGNVLAAKESFSTDALGFPRSVAEGETFRQGHPITEAHPGAFEPWKIDNDIEQATAAPGEKRTKRPRAKKAKKTVEGPVGGQKGDGASSATVEKTATAAPDVKLDDNAVKNS
jgi:hypothetical protein